MNILVAYWSPDETDAFAEMQKRKDLPWKEDFLRKIPMCFLK